MLWWEGDKLIIDLHVHTKELSPDADRDAEEAIREAKEKGLDGICFTDHNRAWSVEDTEKLSKKWDFVVIGGMEVDTAEGHMLVFGLHEDIKKTMHVSQLRQMVDKVGGVIVFAHPFKSFLMFGMSDISLDVEQASARPALKVVDALEAFSGRAGESENRLAQDVAKKLGMKGTGGSDGHRPGEIGRCVTIFENDIKNEAELIAELKAGRFSADYFVGGKR